MCPLVTGFLAERQRTPRPATLEQSFNQHKSFNRLAQLGMDDQTTAIYHWKNQPF
jgi:hypothetical protein